MKKKDAPRGFVFYSQDYFGDVLVRLMPPELRLAWVEAFLLMDQSPRRGVLLKKNGEPYSQSELAKVMNCSTDNVQKMFDWVVQEGIASVDRRSNTLMNRRMFREENRRKINEKNGRKGGNPALITTSAKTVLAVSVNQNDNRPDKSRARVPDPEPDPEPDPVLPRPVHNSLNIDYPPTEKRGGRPRDLASDHFALKCLELTGAPYVAEAGDFVMLAKLRKGFGTENRQAPPGWEGAVENYFGSPLSQYSLADLANPKRYGVFRNSPLDEFNKPINHVNRGNGNGRQPKTKSELNRESSERILARFDRQDREREQCDNPGRDEDRVHGKTVPPES